MTGPTYNPESYTGLIDDEEMRQMVYCLLHELRSLNVNLFQIQAAGHALVQEVQEIILPRASRHAA